MYIFAVLAYSIVPQTHVKLKLSRNHNVWKIYYEHTVTIKMYCTFPFSVFKPIFASAKMCINPNAEVELKSPKANLHLEVQNIAIEMTKPQVWLHLQNLYR